MTPRKSLGRRIDEIAVACLLVVVVIFGVCLFLVSLGVLLAALVIQ